MSLLSEPTNRMGKGKKWIKAESIALAEAFVASSEDGSVVGGTNQTAERFWLQKVIPEFRHRAPGVCDPEHFHNRPMNAIKAHWRDCMSKDVQKFNRALLVIYNSNPTGTTEQEKINMAVAYHLEKADEMDYHFKNFDASQWYFYECWLVLHTHPKFLPPSPSGIDAAEEEEEEEDDAAVENNGLEANNEGLEDKEVDAKATTGAPARQIRQVSDGNGTSTDTNNGTGANDSNISSDASSRASTRAAWHGEAAAARAEV